MFLLTSIGSCKNAHKLKMALGRRALFKKCFHTNGSRNKALETKLLKKEDKMARKFDGSAAYLKLKQ